ncbi:hypothetical protein HII36_38640 [Nonomuraea sp. NN258]|uniref:DUF6223 family protein n=1 Tax=Nonomuraea antri TaxID=2730852 RepID=UPI00156974A0|nr:DUF6223 family protein [Nonomuraea antri]NRQ37707.1 hypothetical protein [Nonomuraea antri]
MDVHSPSAATAALLAQADAPGYLYLSAGRIGAIVAALIGLAGVIIGGLALGRSTGRIGRSGRVSRLAHLARFGGDGRRGAVVALVAGLIGLALAGVTMATSDGGIGTGNGLAGAYVAALVAVTGTALGGVAFARNRREVPIHRA